MKHFICRTYLHFVALLSPVAVVLPFSINIAPPLNKLSTLPPLTDTSNDHPPTTPTLTTAAAKEVHSLAKSSAHQIPGSINNLRKWRHWSKLAITHIRHTLVTRYLPCAIDTEGVSKLKFELGVAADTGARPSFSHAGSRAGYAVDFFCRAQLLADLLWDNKNCGGETSLFTLRLGELLSYRGGELSLSSSPLVRVSSLGGGPGYDFVAVALVAYFSLVASPLSVVVRAKVYDYEMGWEDLVVAMSCATGAVLGGVRSGSSSVDGDSGECECDWGGKCDITQALNHPHNAALTQEEIENTDLWICQYCVAENAKELRDNEFVFFKELFDACREGSLFVLTETTHRLWPDIIDAIGSDVHVEFSRKLGRGKSGEQMMLVKKRGAVIGEEELKQIQLFRRNSKSHERKVENGFVRQGKKVKGAK